MNQTARRRDTGAFPASIDTAERSPANNHQPPLAVTQPPRHWKRNSRASDAPPFLTRAGERAGLPLPHIAQGSPGDALGPGADKSEHLLDPSQGRHGAAVHLHPRHPPEVRRALDDLWEVRQLAAREVVVHQQSVRAKHRAVAPAWQGKHALGVAPLLDRSRSEAGAKTATCLASARAISSASSSPSFTGVWSPE